MPRLLALASMAFSCMPAHAETRIDLGESITVAERPAFVWLPPEEERRSPQPWVMYAPTLPAYPDKHEQWMHERFLDAGVAVAGIDAGETYGSPRGQRLMSALYDELVTDRGFAAKPCLLGRSRGGLMVSSWALVNRDKFAGIAGIYTVFDLRSYPGIDKAAGAYGLSESDLAARLDVLNPIERTHELAEARSPLFIIHGDSDRLVPFDANSGRLVDQYREAGASDAATLIVAKGHGHSFWPGFFRSEPLIEFVIQRARAGAEE